VVLLALLLCNVEGESLTEVTKMKEGADVADTYIIVSIRGAFVRKQGSDL
jgi:hypothetical protein